MLESAHNLERPIPAVAELLQRARALIPSLIERGPQADSERRVPDQTVADMQAAGFFHALQPRRWGGYEIDLGAFYDIQMTLAEGDMSTAWIYGVLGVTPWVMALLDDRAARDVWADDPSTLIGLALAPSGTVTPADGGIRLSGRWRYASGSRYCDWALLGAAVAPVGDAPEGARPDWRMYLVPKSDYQLVDTWFTVGLKGTGSNDIVVNDAFVPEHRMRRMGENVACTGPGQQLNPGALYRIPFGQVFGGGVAYGAIGALQGMLDAFRAYATSRSRLFGRRIVDDPDAQLIAAEAENAIDELRTILHRNVKNLTRYANLGEVPPRPERMKYKYQMATACERCRVLATRLFQAAGATGILSQHRFGGILADITAARQHITNQYELCGREWGAIVLGHESMDDPMQ